MARKARRIQIVLWAVAALLIMPCAGWAAEYGIASKYVRDQGLAYDPDVLLFADYEDGENFRYGWALGQRIYTVDSNPANVLLGTHSIRADLVPGSTGGGDRMLLSKPETCLYQRWYIKLQSGFATGPNGMKNHGFAGFGPGYDPSFPQGSAGLRPTGTDKLYAIICTSVDNRIGMYYYHPDQLGGWGDASGSIGPVLGTGTWACFEIMVKLNDLGSANGELKAWVNGNLTFARTNLRWRSTVNLPINLILDHVYNEVVQTQSVWFDNRVVARKYIGPASGAGPNAAAIPSNPPPVPADTIMPTTSGFFPAANATGVASKTMITFHLKDDRGVDSNTLVLRVNGQIVKPKITGFSKDFTVVYPNSVGYPSGTVVPVSVNVKDLWGNAMPAYNYSFTIAGTPGIVRQLSTESGTQANSFEKACDVLGRQISLKDNRGGTSSGAAGARIVYKKSKASKMVIMDPK